VFSSALGAAQKATDQGALPYQALAVGLLALSAVLAGLWWIYWQATTPPARRAYVPPLMARRSDLAGRGGPVGVRFEPGLGMVSVGLRGEAE
jgi:membrane protein implicated in regulation of membrane protease activity